MSVSEISKITRIPAPTARRYASLFKEFLPSKRVGRVTKYSEEAVQIFERIANLYADGSVTTEIEELLRADLFRTIEVESSQGTEQVQAPQLLTSELSTTVSELMGKFANTLEVIADQKILIETQREDIQKLKTAFVLLARSQKKLRELPNESVTEFANEMTRKTSELKRKDQELEELALGLSYDSSDMKIKLQILESELVRLRKDRREMEQYLQEKINRLKETN